MFLLGFQHEAWHTSIGKATAPPYCDSRPLALRAVQLWVLSDRQKNFDIRFNIVLVDNA
jgi:hypothetical protein